MNPPIHLAKAALRAQLRFELSRVSPSERTRASLRAGLRLTAQAVWRRASGILFYWPRPDELDVVPWIEQAWVEGKTVALPRYDPQGQTYQAGRVVNRHRDLAPGRYGIHEPTGDCPVLPANQLDLMLVPGLAFDLRGWRLGRGSGHYDRLLAALPGIRIGTGYDFQVLPRIPFEPHDVTLNGLLTPERWIECNAHPAL